MAEYHDLIHTVNKLRPETLLKLFDAIDVWRKPPEAGADDPDQRSGRARPHRL